MNEPSFDISQIAKVVESIRENRAQLNTESRRLRTDEILESFDQLNPESWCVSVMADSLIKLRLFTEQNFNFIESMGTVAVARYVFELGVWLSLFQRDCRYGLMYGAQLYETQLKYWQDYLNQALREIDLLNRLDDLDKDLQKQALEEFTAREEREQKTEAYAAAVKFAAERVDAEAARHFSLFSEQAKFNGYGFQSHLVKTKKLPELQSAVSEVRSAGDKFNLKVKSRIEDILPNRWNWRQMARKVEMQNEYDFLYTFASKLLHATPVSITTNQKNLEPEEMCLFLKYINIKILDVLDLAKGYPKQSVN